MARADLLLQLVRGASEGNRRLVQNSLEAMIVEERAKQHFILADRLAEHLSLFQSPLSPPRTEEAFSSSELYFELRPRRTMEDLILPDGVENSISELTEEHNRASLLNAHNLEPRHRILLVGPPGNGKTSLAEAIAGELAVPMIVARYEGIIGSYLGETSLRIAKLFSDVRSKKCVLFLDEFDVLGKERGDTHETGEIKRVVSSLLLQIDRLPSTVVVVTATNHRELLDRAVWRRFQLCLELPRPTKKMRVAWFSQFEEKTGISLEHKHDYIARKLVNMSFAEIEQFSLDIQRRYVLSIPNPDIRMIVQERLGQWEARQRLNRRRSESNDDRPANSNSR